MEYLCQSVWVNKRALCKKVLMCHRIFKTSDPIEELLEKKNTTRNGRSTALYAANIVRAVRDGGDGTYHTPLILLTSRAPAALKTCTLLPASLS